MGIAGGGQTEVGRFVRKRPTYQCQGTRLRRGGRRSGDTLGRACNARSPVHPGTPGTTSNPHRGYQTGQVRPLPPSVRRFRATFLSPQLHRSVSGGTGVSAERRFPRRAPPRAGIRACPTRCVPAGCRRGNRGTGYARYARERMQSDLFHVRRSQGRPAAGGRADDATRPCGFRRGAKGTRGKSRYKSGGEAPSCGRAGCLVRGREASQRNLLNALHPPSRSHHRRSGFRRSRPGERSRRLPAPR